MQESKPLHLMRLKHSWSANGVSTSAFRSHSGLPNFRDGQRSIHHRTVVTKRNCSNEVYCRASQRAQTSTTAAWSASVRYEHPHHHRRMVNQSRCQQNDNRDRCDHPHRSNASARQQQLYFHTRPEGLALAAFSITTHPAKVSHIGKRRIPVNIFEHMQSSWSHDWSISEPTRIQFLVQMHRYQLIISWSQPIRSSIRDSEHVPSTTLVRHYGRDS